jgi:hypothetical protein
LLRILNRIYQQPVLAPKAAKTPVIIARINDVQEKIDKRVVALMKIKQLEEKQPRLIREIFLHSTAEGIKRLQDMEDQIAELRKDL